MNVPFVMMGTERRRAAPFFNDNMMRSLREFATGFSWLQTGSERVPQRCLSRARKRA